MSKKNRNGKGEWGMRMTSLQYEALCRHALARIYGMGVREIHGGHLLGTSNRRQKTRHQIDLYWDVYDGLGLEYRVFANAKWRVQNLDMEDVMHTIGVWRDIGAHKAVLITNVGFDIGVKKQAEEKGIGLLIVRPCGEFEGLGTRKVEELVGQIERMAGEREVFLHEVVHKGWEGTKGLSDEGTKGNAGSIGTGWEGKGGAGEGAGLGVGRGLGEGEREGEGKGNAGEVEGGIWVIGGSGGGRVASRVKDKAMRVGRIRNKMMG